MQYPVKNPGVIAGLTNCVRIFSKEKTGFSEERQGTYFRREEGSTRAVDGVLPDLGSSTILLKNYRRRIT